jgi:hypothetical protein
VIRDEATGRTNRAPATGSGWRALWGNWRRGLRAGTGALVVGAGATLLALAPSGVAGALGGPGHGGQTGNGGSNGGLWLESQHCGQFGQEALLATQGKPGKPGPGQGAVFFYEDETPLCGVQASATLQGPGGQQTTVSLPVTASLRYPAVFWPYGVSESEQRFLKKRLLPVDPWLGGSPPNAANPLPLVPGWNGAVAPWVTELQVSVPEGLAPGSYHAELTVWDHDGESETYCWYFIKEKSTVPVGSVGGLGVAAVLGGGLLLVQGNRRRRRPCPDRT